MFTGLIEELGAVSKREQRPGGARIVVVGNRELEDGASVIEEESAAPLEPAPAEAKPAEAKPADDKSEASKPATEKG